MSRYTQLVELPHVDVAYVAQKATEYLLKEGFRSVHYKGGTYYKKTDGWFVGLQYIKFSFKTVQKFSVKVDEMSIEAFIKFPLLPGIAVGEMGITGSFCSVMKTALVMNINSLGTYTQKVIKEFLKENPGQHDYPEVSFTLG